MSNSEDLLAHELQAERDALKARVAELERKLDVAQRQLACADVGAAARMSRKKALVDGAAAERARIVAWLRDAEHKTVWTSKLAAAIESGAHLPGAGEAES